MAIVNPLVKRKGRAGSAQDLRRTDKTIRQDTNIFATMAHRPNVLKNFLPFYGAVMDEGTVEARDKETRLFEDVATQRLRVLNPRTHRSAKRIGITGEQIQALQFLRPQPVV